MIEREGRIDRSSERKEYAFEKGLQSAMEKIEQLLASQEYVVVTITGSAGEVGKTTFAGKLSTAMRRKDISLATVGDLFLFARGPKPYFPQSGKSGRVLLFGTEGVPLLFKGETIAQGEERQNAELKKCAEQFQLPITKVDLRIFIYRPDKPFDNLQTKFADILIRNEYAKDRKK